MYSSAIIFSFLTLDMKLLILYCDLFEYQISTKSIDGFNADRESDSVKDAIVAFLQLEKEDELILKKQETKFVKQIKWAAGKNNTRKIVLHSFAHLSESKANPLITKSFIDSAEQRLKTTDYEVSQTPYGYFLNLNIKAPGHPLARLFNSY